MDISNFIFLCFSSGIILSHAEKIGMKTCFGSQDECMECKGMHADLVGVNVNNSCCMHISP